MLFLSMLFSVTCIAVGLGVGLGVGLNNHHSADNDAAPQVETKEDWWQPVVKSSWQIELLYPLNKTDLPVDIFDIDLFDNEKSLINQLQNDGKKVICYFSAGSYENWRPDAGDFHKEDLGKALDGWEGERWVNVSSSDIRDIMKARLDLAQSKGCDGVDPDNIDGYENSNGLGLSTNDAIDYVNFLADEAHSRGLSIGLKNGKQIISDVIENMQWSVNEQCAQYDECGAYKVFPDSGRPIFHIEYPKGDDVNNNKPVSDAKKDAACKFDGSDSFSTLIKNINLDNWFQLC